MNQDKQKVFGEGQRVTVDGDALKESQSPEDSEAQFLKEIKL